MRAVPCLFAASLACSAPAPLPAPPDAGSVDSCAGAATLTTAPVILNTSKGTSSYTTECGGTGNDLLFRVTLTEPHDVMLVANPLDIGMPVVALFEKPCTPGRLTTLACGAGSLTAYNLPPGEYYALLDSDVGNEGPSELDLVLSAPTPPPANDRCAQAQALAFTDGGASAFGDTRSATNDLDASCAHGGRDVVYAYTLSQPRTVTITVTPLSRVEPAVFVTSACTGPDLACAPKTLTLRDQPAGTYFLWVDGAGAFTLDVRQ